MRIDGSVRAETYIDGETESIMLRHWHPRINNYNAVVMFLLQCNMDIKYIGSGPAVHIGLQALQSAIKGHKARFENEAFCSSQFSEKNWAAVIITQHTSFLRYGFMILWTSLLALKSVICLRVHVSVWTTICVYSVCVVRHLQLLFDELHLNK